MPSAMSRLPFVIPNSSFKYARYVSKSVVSSIGMSWRSSQSSKSGVTVVVQPPLLCSMAQMFLRSIHFCNCMSCNHLFSMSPYCRSTMVYPLAYSFSSAFLLFQPSCSVSYITQLCRFSGLQSSGTELRSVSR